MKATKKDVLKQELAEKEAMESGYESVRRRKELLKNLAQIASKNSFYTYTRDLLGIKTVVFMPLGFPENPNEILKGLVKDLKAVEEIDLEKGLVYHKEELPIPLVIYFPVGILSMVEYKIEGQTQPIYANRLSYYLQESLICTYNRLQYVETLQHPLNEEDEEPELMSIIVIGNANKGFKTPDLEGYEIEILKYQKDTLRPFVHTDEIISYTIPVYEIFDIGGCKKEYSPIASPRKIFNLI